MENNQTFLYFAYGSNLLKERLQLKNPSATVYCVARLKDYKLVFGNYKGLASDRWHGGVATIEDSPGDEVWGVVWRMSISDLESLDNQENVMLGAYRPVELSVKTKGQDISCRTYIMNSCVYARPSPQYLQLLLYHNKSEEPTLLQMKTSFICSSHFILQSFILRLRQILTAGLYQDGPWFIIISPLVSLA
ncbi:gamma-glutamylcyclotransferase isoform X5 [Poecilia reticulata]|nr:PREDICTED: gamma-glutamylcyclotransferase-like isoform X5 [Poecilia reticulata]